MRHMTARETHGVHSDWYMISLRGGRGAEYLLA